MVKISGGPNLAEASSLREMLASHGSVHDENITNTDPTDDGQFASSSHRRMEAAAHSRLLALREESRIATDHGVHLKAPVNNRANGNSAFFSRSEKATLAEILKLDSMSQVLNPKKFKTEVSRVSMAIPPLTRENTLLGRFSSFHQNILTLPINARTVKLF